MIRRMGTHSLSLEEMADQAEVDLDYIRRLIDLGALEELLAELDTESVEAVGPLSPAARRPSLRHQRAPSGRLTQ